MRVCFTAIELPWCPCPFLSLSLVSMSTAESLWQKAKSQLVCFFRDKRPLLVINTNKHTYCFRLNYSERRLIREFLKKPVIFFFGNLSNQNFLKVECDCGVPCLTAMLFSLTTTTHCFHRCLMGLWACLPAACQPIFTSVRWSFHWSRHFTSVSGMVDAGILFLQLLLADVVNLKWFCMTCRTKMTGWVHESCTVSCTVIGHVCGF